MKIIYFCAIFLSLAACTSQSPLEYALDFAGTNRAELESVLDHYKDDPEKLAAAQFLIENMPVHISYRDSTIDKYYEIAHNLLKTDMPYREIRDSLINVRKNLYPGNLLLIRIFILRTTNPAKSLALYAPSNGIGTASCQCKKFLASTQLMPFRMAKITIFGI
jgi:hypothetical protein